MATLYADRVFLSVNGQQVADVQSGTLRVNQNSKAVPSMTPDRYNRGFVRGNVDIDITAQIAVQAGLARPKLDWIDYGANSVQLTFVVGANNGSTGDQFVCKDLFIKDTDDGAGGVGDEVKTTFNWGALRIVDQVGNSVLFDSSGLTIIK